jgi:ABC-type cobalamin/Fe3+-siderophores transport system ATPase subunit
LAQVFVLLLVLFNIEGKTTLLRALRRVSVKRGRITFRTRSLSKLLEQRSHVSGDAIDIDEWGVEVPRQESEQVLFTTIDYGGQVKIKLIFSLTILGSFPLHTSIFTVRTVYLFGNFQLECTKGRVALGILAEVY